MRGRSVIRIVPPAATISFAELESQFARPIRVEADQRPAVADSYDALRKQYALQSRRAQQRFADPRIKQPVCAALFHLAVESVKASRLAYTALQESERAVRSSDGRVVSPEVVERAIDWNRQQLDRLDGQLRLLDLVDDVLLPLEKLFDQLEGSRHVSALGWRSIARHILSQTHHRGDALALLPLPGFSLKAYLTYAGHGPFGEAFSRGIETILALGPLVVDRDAESTAVDVLSIAALCQDCGLLLLARSRRSPDRADEENDRAAHASLSAAVVAGIAEFAAEIPALVSEHHRRFLGVDRVPNLAAPLQGRESRLLAATVRFLEIVDELSMAGLSPTVGGELAAAALYPAALRLNHEAARGDWDQQSTCEILSGLGFQWKDETIESGSDEPRYGRTLPENRRLDPADLEVPDPNFLLAQETREGRHVRTTSRR